jgi:sugar O-acyltransferase (sialic acid O-acetyltransferase NeuD family)
MGQSFVILGAGGFAREVLDIFEARNAAGHADEMLGFVVDAEYGQPGVLVNDKPILGGFDWLADHARDVLAVCGVGDPAVRRRMVLRAREAGARFGNAMHPNAILTRRVTLGEGVIITAGCIFTNQIRVGHHVQVNLDCTIGHDAILEDFVTLAPGVHVSGNVTLREGAYVGTAANIIEKKTIGAWSVVGAGSVVTSDVPPNATVVGVPGKVIKTREAGWQLKS